MNDRRDSTGEGRTAESRYTMWENSWGTTTHQNVDYAMTEVKQPSFNGLRTFSNPPQEILCASAAKDFLSPALQVFVIPPAFFEFVDAVDLNSLHEIRVSI